MCDLDEVVDLGAGADPRLANGGAVDSHVGPDLDIVFDHEPADLWNFPVSAIGHARKAEAVASEHGTVLDDDPVADRDTLTDRDVTVDQAVCTDRGAASDRGMGVDDGARPDVNAIGDGDECTDRGRRIDGRTRVDVGEPVDAGRRLPRIGKERDRVRERQIGVVVRRTAQGAPSTVPATITADAAVRLRCAAYSGSCRS